MKKVFKFTYHVGKPVRDYGKIVLLDKNRKWCLVEGVEYVIENLQLLELEKCIIIKSGSFLRVDDILPQYEVIYGPYVNVEKREVNFGVKRTVVYRQEVLDTETDHKNFKFGLTGNEEFYNLLPIEAQQRVDDFRVWMTWINQNRQEVLDGTQDFLAYRSFQLLSDTELLQVRESGSGSAENPKEVSVLKLRKLVFKPVFQNGFEPADVQEPSEVTRILETLTLEESGLPSSFRPVWKSTSMMVGVLTINGEEVKGLVKHLGDGTGSYLDAVMYLGDMMIPPDKLSDDDIAWMDRGGKICWVYDFSTYSTRELSNQSTTITPADPNGWVRVNSICGNSVRYIQERFNHKDYVKMVEESRPR